MKPRNTWILVALTLLVLAYILLFDRQTASSDLLDPRILPNLSASSVTSIQVAWDRKPAMRADLTNGTWQLSAPLVYPAQSVAIVNLLRALEKLSHRTHIGAQELREHPQADEEYGLKVPLVTIILRQGTEEKHLKIGKLTAPGDEVYLQVVGKQGIDTVDAAIFQYIPRDPDPWRDHTVVNLAGLNFDRMVLVGGSKLETTRIELQRDASETPWRMTFPIQARVDNRRMDQWLYNLQALNATRFVTDDSGVDLEPWGLQPPQLEVTMNAGTNVLVALQFGRSPTNDPTLIYARRAGQRTVMLVPRAAVDPWRGPYTEFRDRHLVGQRAFSAETIDVISRGAEPFKLRRQTNGIWQVAEPQNFPVDARRMRDFLETLANLESVPVNNQFSVKENVLPAELAKWGLAPPTRQYILSQTATNPLAPGTLTNQVLVELDFGSVTDDRDKVLARRTDESSIYAARLPDFTKLPATSLQMRDRHIWRFAESNVVSLSVRQEGQTMKVLREGDFKYSLAPASTGSIDPNDPMIEAALGDLGELDAANWIEYGEINRERYQLSDRGTQITVELRQEGRPTTLSLDLGGWSPQKLRYAAVRLDGQNWVFELPAKLYLRLISFLKMKEPLAP